VSIACGVHYTQSVTHLHKDEKAQKILKWDDMRTHEKRHDKGMNTRVETCPWQIFLLCTIAAF